VSAPASNGEQHWFSGPPKYAAAAALILMTVVALGASMFVPRVPRGSIIAPSALAVVKIDLNSASAAELEALPRIGPALARRIVDDREKYGPFRKIEDLDRVPGIGPKTLELVRPYAKVTPEVD
jgi:competence ComEA-like helix-hairpin-helix protein